MSGHSKWHNMKGVNMTEEKAIERCKELIKTEHSCWIGITNQLAIKTVIKKYENQQSELEKKDALINTMQAEFERLENLEDNTDMLKVEIEKKNKIIDLMAEDIKELDIDEDICMNNVQNTELCNESYSNCKECIKQYFERKAELK